LAKNLYVGNLSYSVGQNELTDLFKAYGTVESVNVIIDRETGRSKGFAFVEMGTAQQGQAAIDALHDKELDGRKLTVNAARPREDRSSGFGGGGRREGGFKGGRGF
jgi:RNA recognition motif-containing protein